jgi:hypothetical protein
MTSFTWNSKWTMIDESSHSLLQKFLYLNSLTEAQLRKLLKENNEQLSNYIKSIGIHSIDLTKKQEKQAEKLKICPKCILYGYHSNYHQRSSHCFIHGDLLYSSCKRCGKVFVLNRLNQYYYKSPYICICGFSVCNGSDILYMLINQDKHSSVGNELTLRLTISFDDSFEHLDLNITEELLDEVLDTTTILIRDTLNKIAKQNNKSYYYFTYPEIDTKPSLRDYFKIKEKEILSRFYHETKELFNHENLSEMNRLNYTIPLMLRIIKMRQLGSKIRQVNLGLYENLSDHQSIVLPISFITWYDRFWIEINEGKLNFPGIL